MKKDGGCRLFGFYRQNVGELALRGQRTVHHAHPVTDTPSVLATLRKGAVFAVFHPHPDCVMRGGARPFFDFIATVTTGNGTGDCRQGSSITAPNLVAQQATYYGTNTDPNAAWRSGLLVRYD